MKPWIGVHKDIKPVAIISFEAYTQARYPSVLLAMMSDRVGVPLVWRLNRDQFIVEGYTIDQAIALYRAEAENKQ